MLHCSAELRQRAGTQADHLLRLAVSGKFMASMLRADAEADVSDAATKVRCPVLVLHARDDPRIPFEEGRRLASLFPDARFAPLPSRNNWSKPSEPAFSEVVRQILDFNRVNARSATCVATTCCTTVQAESIIPRLTWARATRRPA